MIVWTADKTADSPPARDLWQEISVDWYGKAVEPPPRFIFWMDRENFYFASAHQGPAVSHPDGVAGRFQPELWRYDVSEFFLAAKKGYLEVNLAPNGAWWACFFEAPRRPPSKSLELGRVRAQAKLVKREWLAQIAIPLVELDTLLPGWREGRLNANFILGSPKQQFFSAADLSAEKPDFHRPEEFPKIKLKFL